MKTDVITHTRDRDMGLINYLLPKNTIVSIMFSYLRGHVSYRIHVVFQTFESVTIMFLLGHVSYCIHVVFQTFESVTIMFLLGHVSYRIHVVFQTFESVTIMFLLGHVSYRIHVVFQTFESVTIMFSYLLGFTDLCADVSAMDLVSCINCVFTTFDAVVDQHNVFKVPTSLLIHQSYFFTH